MNVRTLIKRRRKSNHFKPYQKNLYATRSVIKFETANGSKSINEN